MFYKQLEDAIVWFRELWPDGWVLSQPWNVHSILAIVLVCLVCGSVGSLVIGNRMSFFSDALAHCAFAGVALGILLALISGRPRHEIQEDHLFLSAVMVAFGVVVGLLIAFVRDKTLLSNDTVIGVFFAGAIGLGAMLLTAVTRRGYFNLEQFLFGDPVFTQAQDLEALFWLLVLTGLFLCFAYNSMVFASFNTSLAQSRGVRTRFCNYLFIVLLGIIVNLCIQIVGVLLINAMLIVPAATAANWSRNMRQFFRRSVVIAFIVGILGFWLRQELSIPDPPRDPLKFGISGVIIVTSVLFFTLSMLTPALGRMFRRRPESAPPR